MRSAHGVLIGAHRKCGWRIRGGVYWECPSGSYNPLVPHTPVDPAALRLSHIGVRLIQRHGVTHVLDWVGETHYPPPESFLDEASRMGISRRLASTVSLHALTADSRLLLVHSHARFTDGTTGPGIIASVPLAGLVMIQADAGRVAALRTRAHQDIPVSTSPY